MDLSLRGRIMECDEAHRLGFVNTVVPRSEVLAEARRVAADLVYVPPLEAQMAERLAILGREHPDRLMRAMRDLHYAAGFNARDAAEGSPGLQGEAKARVHRQAELKDLPGRTRVSTGGIGREKRDRHLPAVRNRDNCDPWPAFGPEPAGALLPTPRESTGVSGRVAGCGCKVSATAD